MERFEARKLTRRVQSKQDVTHWIEHKYSSFKKIIVSLVFSVVIMVSHAQSDIPIGEWRMHLSYNRMIALATGPQEIYGATENGVLVYNKSDNSLTTYNKLNGLSDTGITFLAFDAQREQLIITYADGNIDILKADVITNFSRLKNLSAITGSKRINHIFIKNDLAYLSTNYGVTVFDLIHQDIKETWRDLGIAGQQLKVNQSFITGDSVMLATENGVLIGNLNNNLLDFNYWSRFNTGDISGTVQAVTKFDNTIYAAIDDKGLYALRNGDFVATSILSGTDFYSMETSSGQLLIAAASGAWIMNPSGELNPLANDLITSPVMVKEDSPGTYWIADARNGLVSNISGNFTSYLPNGPTVAQVYRLKFIDKKLYLLPVEATNGVEPSLDNHGYLNFLDNGEWKLFSTTQNNLVDIEYGNNTLYLASDTDGLAQVDNDGNITRWTSANSPMNADEAGSIAAIEYSSSGLWVSNGGGSQQLYLLKRDNAWQSFIVPTMRQPTNLAVDPFENVWIVNAPQLGGGITVLDPSNGSTVYRSEVAGGGALPNPSVISIAIDRDGNAWVGTATGVAYFYAKNQDAVRPIFENRFLLKDEKITAIAVDGGNRKWLGTEKGVWLFNDTGEELIKNYTVENSPLLSNVIRDIEINDESGEVFFATDKGIVSFRGDATGSDAAFQSIKIFPNPVTSTFSGQVGISGLATDAYVKITDISGKLIWQVQANGGTATWNVRDYNGTHAATGIYLVFAVTEDGSESIVGKIAVIE